MRFLFLGAALMAVLYAALYFPYEAGQWPARALQTYINGLAAVVGFLLSLVDSTVTVQGDHISGRFPLRIVLDCAALDAQALFAAAVLAYPAAWPRKLKALGIGLVAIGVLNLGRIISLYFVGIHWSTGFHVLHEEVMPLALVLFSVSLFALWTLSLRGVATPVIATKA